MRLWTGVVVACVAWFAASAALASPPPTYVQRDVAFVTPTGKGVVTIHPQGVKCPPTCRVVFTRGTHVSFTAVAAPGWSFAGFSSKWCAKTKWTCGFDLVSPHDCSGGACPLGAYGVRALFVRKE